MKIIFGRLCSVAGAFFAVATEVAPNRHIEPKMSEFFRSISFLVSFYGYEHKDKIFL